MLVASKRQAFHSQIRSKQIHTIIAKIRYRVAKENKSEVLESIMAATTEAVTPQQLIVLMRWGLLGEDNAVLHIGNLIIDDILDMAMVHECQDKIEAMGETGWLGDGECYLWLLHILYERNHFREKELLHLAKSIMKIVNQARRSMAIGTLSHKSMFFDHGLSLLRSIISKHTSAAELIIMQQKQEFNRNFLKCLVFLCQSSLDSTVTSTCYSILNCLSTVEVKSFCLSSLLSSQQLKSLAEKGRLKMEAKVRCLTYQIFTNMLATTCEIPEPLYLELILSVLPGWREQKLCVQIEISFLVLGYIKRCHPQIVKHLVIEGNIVKYVLNVLESIENSELLANCIDLLRTMRNMEGLLKGELKQNQLSILFLFSQKLGARLQQMERSIEQ